MLPLVVHAPDTGLGEILWGLACTVAGYSGVRGMLYRRTGEAVTVWIVAPAPMGRPMRLLAGVWARELGRADPTRRWAIRVSEDPPRPGGAFRCLFWRKSWDPGDP
ncbi:MAG: hypothetical protein SCH98_16280 [Deferrisomatales bacterium]|nr:hypothetical protein [Deferrisomatales bacterium]